MPQPASHPGCFTHSAGAPPRSTSPLTAHGAAVSLRHSRSFCAAFTISRPTGRLAVALRSMAASNPSPIPKPKPHPNPHPKPHPTPHPDPNPKPHQVDGKRVPTPADTIRPWWTPPGIAFPFIWLTITGLRAISSMIVFKACGRTLFSPPLLLLALHLAVGDTWNR